MGTELNGNGSLSELLFTKRSNPSEQNACAHNSVLIPNAGLVSTIFLLSAMTFNYGIPEK